MIRLAIQQPSLAAYRVPVFRELAARKGIDLTVYYGQSPGLANVEPEGFRAVRTPLRRVGTARWHSAQLSLATRRKCDVLMLGWDLHYLSLVPALLRAKAAGVKTILWGHGYSKRESPRRRALRLRVGKMATATLFYNRSAAEAAIGQGLERERVFVALNSLDQAPISAARSKWMDDPARLEAFRRENSLTGPTVLFCSRLERANRVELLLRAVALLKDEILDLTAVIIGSGEHLMELQELAAALHIAPRVRFLGAIYDEDKLAPWFCSAFCFCYPANIGLSILHAMGYGLPAVTSNRRKAQNPEIEALREGENGLLFRDGDPAALADALRRLHADESLRQRLSAEALRTVREQFTLSRMVDGMMAAVRFCERR